MRVSKTLVPTLKEAPSEAEVPSHIFMVRGGYLRKVAAGIYSFLPLGWRVVNKVERIIREEMDRSGASEVFLPAVIPAELWKESGRWQNYGDQLLRFKDRKGGDFVIGPTHEEVISALVRGEVRSWRQLPLNLYQIQTKFRDELRPRAGLMRGREFIMKDAYSFHVDVKDAEREYRVMYETYQRIFTRCGLAFRAVEADTGNIGGSLSHEFQVLTETGEDALVACDKCDYAANVEQAVSRAPKPGTPAAGARVGEVGLGPTEPVAGGYGNPPRVPGNAVQRVATPGKHTIADVSTFLSVTADKLVKTLIYLADGKPIAALVRGDRDVNEIKLKKALGANQLVLATDAAVREVTGAPVGFAGPVGLKVPIYCDVEVCAMVDFVVGANEADAHLTGVNIERDFTPTACGDYRIAAAGDACARCDGGHLKPYRGIEVGQVFYLGTKYSKPMGVTFLDAGGQEQPAEMGCYGIGVTRIVAAAIEQNHDKDGIVWPVPLAPYEVAVLDLQQDDPAVVATAARIYDELTAAGIEVLYDDRNERAGVKFKDADLIGLPFRIAVGKKGLAEGVVELKRRRSPEVRKLKIEEAARVVAAEVMAERS
jgi:prolyl-tRNA synthetase